MADAAMHEWVRRVLGFDPEKTAPKTPAKAELTGRLISLRDRMTGAGAAAALAGGLREAANAVKADDPGALQLIEALERQLANLSQANGQGAPKDVAEIGACADLRLRVKSVQSAQEWAAVTLQTACRRMLRTPAFEDDEQKDSPEVQAVIADIGSRVPSFAPFSATIEAALGDMERTGEPATRAKCSKQARGAITAYRGQLDAEPLLKTMEDSEAGSFGIYSAIAEALNELDGALN